MKNRFRRVPISSKSSNGQSIVEIVISILLLAIVAAGIFGVILTAKKQTTKSKAHEDATLSANQLIQELQNYVTALDTTDPLNLSSAPGTPPSWHYPGDTNTGWALAVGNHEVSTLLPLYLQSAPYTAHLTYTVTVVPVNGQNMNQVNVQITWQEPSA